MMQRKEDDKEIKDLMQKSDANRQIYEAQIKDLEKLKKDGEAETEVLQGQLKAATDKAKTAAAKARQLDKEQEMLQALIRKTKDGKEILKLEKEVEKLKKDKLKSKIELSKIQDAKKEAEKKYDAQAIKVQKAKKEAEKKNQKHKDANLKLAKQLKDAKKKRAGGESSLWKAAGNGIIVFGHSSLAGKGTPWAGTQKQRLFTYANPGQYAYSFQTDAALGGLSQHHVLPHVVSGSRQLAIDDLYLRVNSDVSNNYQFSFNDHNNAAKKADWKIGVYFWDAKKKTLTRISEKDVKVRLKKRKISVGIQYPDYKRGNLGKQTNKGSGSITVAQAFELAATYENTTQVLGLGCKGGKVIIVKGK